MNLMSQDGRDAQDNTFQIDMVFVAGTAGAVPSTFEVGDGIKSVSLSGTTYTITVEDGFGTFLNVTGSNIQATYAASGACSLIPLAVDTTAGTVAVQFMAGDGSGAVHLAAGDEAHITLRLKY
jgi:hypothetical protein